MYAIQTNGFKVTTENFFCTVPKNEYVHWVEYTSLFAVAV